MLKKLNNLFNLQKVKIKERYIDFKNIDLWKHKILSHISDNQIKTEVEEITKMNLIQYIQDNNTKGISINLDDGFDKFGGPFKIKLRKNDNSLVTTLHINVGFNSSICHIKNNIPLNVNSGEKGWFEYKEPTFREVEFNILDEFPVIFIRENKKDYLQQKGFVGLIRDNILGLSQLGQVNSNEVGLLDTVFLKDETKLDIFFTKPENQTIEIYNHNCKLTVKKKI